MPRTLSKAVSVLVEGRVVSTDVGRCGDRYFTTVAAYGFDAEVSAAMEAGQTPLGGTAGYVLQALHHLRHYTPPQTILSGSFGRFEGPVFLVASANTRSYGGGMQIAPNADPRRLTRRLYRGTAHLSTSPISAAQRISRSSHPPPVRPRCAHGHAGNFRRNRRFISADGEDCGTTPLTLTRFQRPSRHPPRRLATQTGLRACKRPVQFSYSHKSQ